MDGSTVLPERGRTAAGDIDPDAIANEIESRGRTWADLKATAKLLELQMPSVKAATIQNLLDQGAAATGRKITRRDAEDLALLDPEFQLVQETAVYARRAANMAEAEFKAVQARFEAMRTAEATRRAEMHAFSR